MTPDPFSLPWQMRNGPVSEKFAGWDRVFENVAIPHVTDAKWLECPDPKRIGWSKDKTTDEKDKESRVTLFQSVIRNGARKARFRFKPAGVHSGLAVIVADKKSPKGRLVRTFIRDESKKYDESQSEIIELNIPSDGYSRVVVVHSDGGDTKKASLTFGVIEFEIPATAGT